MPELQQPSASVERKGSRSVAARRGRPERGPSGLRRDFVDVLAWCIVIAWATSFIVDMVVKTYDPPASIHALMLTLAGSAFATTLLKKNDPQTEVSSADP